MGAKSYLLCISTLALSAAAAVNAQTQTSAAPSDTQTANSSGSVPVDEIIVTAQKREQRILDVPAAITAVSGATLDKEQIKVATDLVALVPGLKINSSYQTANLNFTIRGIGPSNQYNFNVNAPVGIYSDEIYQAFGPIPAIQFFDDARVEVLKGPQGTLYGRNTTGGAINFISQQPSLDGQLHGHAEVSYGNFNRWSVEGATDLTVVPDKFGLRVALFHSAGDGYMKNPINEQTYGTDDTTEGRVILRIKPTNTLDIRLKLYENRSVGNFPAGYFIGTNPGGTNAGGFTRALLTTSTDAIMDHPGPMDSTAYGGALTIKWQAGPLDWTSITGVQHEHFYVTLDCDSSPVNLCESHYNDPADQISQDFRVHYGSDKIQLIGGVFYGSDTIHHLGEVGFFGFVPAYAAYYRNTFEQSRTSYAVYADGTYEVLPRLKLTFGLRDTFDSLSLANTQTVNQNGFEGTPISMIVPYAYPTYVPGLVYPRQTRRSSGVTGRVVLDYKITPDVLVYGSYSHGYRQGAFNGQQFAPGSINYVGPETDDNYELGVKGQFIDHRVTVALDVFDLNINGQQVISQISGSSGVVPGLAGVNGYSRGIELEASWQVTDWLTARVSATGLDTRFDNDQQVAGVPVGGNKFPFAPAFAGQAGFDWKVWREGDKALTLTMDAYYTGHFYYDPQNGSNSVGEPLHRGSPAYALLNGRLAYDFGPYEVAIWAQNITNQFYLTTDTNTEPGLGYDYAALGTPRTFGMSVKVKF